MEICMLKKLSVTPFVLAILATLAGCGGGSVEVGQPRLLASIVQATETELAANTPVHIAIPLKLNNQDKLDKYIEEIQTPGSRHYKESLTPAEIAEKYGPNKGQVTAVTAFLNAKGFTNIKVAENSLLIEADASSGIAASAFETKLAKFTLADGTPAFANTTPVKVPGNLSGIIHAVLGLDTVARFKVHSVARLAAPQGQGATPYFVAGVVGHNPTEYRTIYNTGSTPSASGVSVGIIGWGDMTQTLADLTTFAQQNGITPPNISVGYAGGQGTDTSSTVEWNIDSQAILAMAGATGVMRFYVAQTATYSDLAGAINAAVTANGPKVINMSFGLCESSTAGYDNFEGYFKVGIAQGQTFVAASGDTGSVSNGCTGTSVSYPASSKYVVAVGGTSLNTDANGGYVSETAWSGSGGGASVWHAIPTWQAIVPLLSGTNNRGMPDISFVADPNSGISIILNGQIAKFDTGETKRFGGTSLAAPLFVATWARVLSQCPTAGFAAPSLYAYRNLHQSMFNDITSGSNGAFSAAAGWDKVTGWGTPNVANLYATVCPTGAEYYALVEQIYMAYVRRPIDPSGLVNITATLRAANAPRDLAGLQAAYATNTSVRTLLDGLQGSGESQSVYPTSTLSSYVTAIFQTLVNRAPTSTELSTYVNGVSNSSIPIANLPLTIMANLAAPNAALLDRMILGNKSAVASNFTSTLTPTNASYYSGSTASNTAKNMLAGVNYSSSAGVGDNDQPTYVSSLQATVNTTIADIVAGIP
jgi:pseudomonalisin